MLRPCPACDHELSPQKTQYGLLYVCKSCKGRAAAPPVLRKIGATPQTLQDIWLQARAPQTPQIRTCPHCRHLMQQVNIPIGTSTLTLDVCRTCPLIWFDTAEFDALPKAPTSHTSGPFLEQVVPSDSSRQTLALAKVKEQFKERTPDIHSPSERWQWLPGLLGLPIEFDAPQCSRKPWITWIITSICVVLAFLTFGSLREIVRDWGFIPSQWSRHYGLTIVTSFFLHGGGFHLLGNMYFLLVFGDNVEDHLGRFLYLFLLTGAHIIGILTHAAFGVDGTIPCVGASAGISGVIAYYALAFPKVRLGMLFRYLYFIYPRWFYIPAWLALILYMGLQLIGSFLQMQGSSGVSYLGHMGGLVVGLFAGWAVHIARNQSIRAALSDMEYTTTLKHMYKR